jgi:DNA-binding response OmpR family regulator
VIRVLHIDDEAPIRLLSRVNLESEGMEVIEAADGRIGLEPAKREQPDVILLGVMMPAMDGWQVAEELRKDPETWKIPVVFLTARAALRDRVRGFHLGAVDYIAKPFNPQNWPRASAGCWNGSSAAGGMSCDARTSSWTY